MTELGLTAMAVSYRVRNAELVSSVDLRLTPGELTVVIGPNGAGKSTLLGLLSGHLLPSSGEVRVNGLSTSSTLPTDLALERSILTQHEPADIPYTAAQVVEMGRFPHRHIPGNSRKADDMAIASAMEQTDTTRFAGRRYATLSKGEQTRVALARVIAQETPIILLDEPTAALDVAHQERIMSRAGRLSHQGKTTVVVLHDLNAAAVHADRVIVMHRGRVAADGLPRDVFREDLLSEVYEQPMRVVEHPFRDCPLVLIADPR